MKNKKTAIISVSDKTGAVEFARSLLSAGYDIIATAGTAKILKKAGVACRDVSALTGFPEMLDGRVKTLHPAVFAGVLAAGPAHMKQLAEFSIKPIEMVVVNLYPFEEKTASHAPRSAASHIDVGGAALLRAAAKNYERVIAVSSPADYPAVAAAAKRGKITAQMRRDFAARAFAATSYYDAVISERLGHRPGASAGRLVVPMRLARVLRYGENPHQSGAFYKDASAGDVSGFPEQLGGKPVSYNNILDISSALSIVGELPRAACAVIKHTNPCGAAVAKTALDAYRAAFATDPVAAFGGVVVFNEPVDVATAEAIGAVFTDCVAAPDFAGKSLAILKRKKNLVIIKTPPSEPLRRNLEIRSCAGGWLAQSPDIGPAEKLTVVTRKKPTLGEIKSLRFAASVAKYSKSNAMVIAAGERTLGVGAGRSSRIDAMRDAVAKMRVFGGNNMSGGVVLASDAFFPFADVIRMAASSGITAILQPGGSIRDSESIKACNEAGIAMVFTSVRHFRH